MLYENYLYGLPGHFTDEECDTIIEIANNNKIVEGQVGPQTDAKKNEGKTVDEIRSSSIVWITQEMLPASIENKIHNAMNKALKDAKWNFDISYRQAYQYTIYNAPETTKKRKGDFYTWHTDAGADPYPDGTIRKISCSVQLSDPDDYEGGHFQWIESAKVFDRIKKRSGDIRLDELIHTAPMSGRELGSLIVFPSWLHHQVTPVTHGVRKSLVVWNKGWPLK